MLTYLLVMELVQRCPCVTETETTTEDMKMFCFVLPVIACEQCVREIQQNIELDMLLFPLCLWAI